MTTRERRRQVAVACQGGGSHTAFTAGVLTTLLDDNTVDIRPLSGTSGGAVCALLAWYGILTKQPKKNGVERLREYWQDNSTHTFWEAWREAAAIGMMRAWEENWASHLSSVLM
jgi:NTE family protein